MIDIFNNSIADALIGSIPVKKVYVGNDVVWEKSSPVLPYDAEISYLEGDGASYIDTGYYANSETSVEMVLRAVSPTQAVGLFSTKATAGCLFSIYQLNKTSSRAFRWQVGYGDDSYYNFQSNNSFANNYTFALKKNKFYINNVIRNTFPETSFTTSSTIPLFAARLGTGIDSRMFNGRIYWCKIWDDETLVRDFIPVRVSTEGCMYDKISRTVFHNQGSGSFILGPDIN